MKNNLLIFLLWCTLAFIASELVAWWAGFLVAFLIHPFIKISLRKTLLIGFTALFSVWITKAMYLDSANNSILSEMVGSLVAGQPPTILLLVTSLIGGLGGLLGGWLAHALFLTEKTRYWSRNGVAD